MLQDATDADGSPVAPAAILIGTGSEVQLAVEARQTLQAEGIPTRVVSAPCLEWFDAQDEDYRSSVLGDPRDPNGPVRVSVEAGVSQGWMKYTGVRGDQVSLEHFGASADYQTLYREFGITADAVAQSARTLLEQCA